jgi:hypothetical protein
MILTLSFFKILLLEAVCVTVERYPMDILTMYVRISLTGGEISKMDQEEKQFV